MSDIQSWYCNALSLADPKPPDSYDSALQFTGWNYPIHGEFPPIAWERQMRLADLPDSLHYDGHAVRAVRVHPKILDVTQRVFKAVHDAGYWSLLDPYAGSYNFRLMKNGQRLSAHAFGLGFDFDPIGNPFRVAKEKTRFFLAPGGQNCVKIFEEYGFFWGGRFLNNPDGMHFQFGVNW